ncbi:hypothetical protein CMUS01_07705 [Colletotrichum musicola]|uniref:NACHT domain-containing protein n=1 Tax=Colletotrichum musicola TaxID=2175873 RepID=A0A8H6KFU5_9PEZI|nr:hypothetical protein CMUS01_07705 [Colletotrichum musicola]
MKYLCQNAQTQEYLQSWAGDKTLITANFWRPGTTIQKSLDGLRRALLFTIMDEIPSLVPVGFPKQWSLAVEDRPCQIHKRDVETALKLVLDQSDLWAAHKVAFFIDGLDEFEGDHDHMMKLLLRWVREYKDSVKLCVSSREWEIFRQRLAGCPSIRLQDITVRDIKSYVSHELSENEEFERLALTSPKTLDVVEQITAKAEGVFLWVKITLRGLKWGLLSGERFEDLKERINGLPTELEALYQSLFDSMKNGRHMNKLDRAKAMRTLLLAHLYADVDGKGHFRPSFMLISHSFLDDYTRVQNFAQKMYVQPIGKGVCDTRLEYARKLIYQRCMGFLETYMIPVRIYGHSRIDLKTHKWEFTEVTEAQRNGMSSSGEIGDDDSDDVSRSIISNARVLSQGTEDQGSTAPSEQGKLAVEDGQESTASWHYAMYEGGPDLIVDEINNSQYPVRHGIRFIHRTALEFLSQPSVSRQIRDAAVQFNEADFELQAIVASMKLFTPSGGYAKDNFIIKLRHRLHHYLVRLGPIPEACFLRFQGEAVRMLRHYGLTVGYHLTPKSTFISTMDVATGSILLDTEDSLLLLAVRTGASHGLSSLTGHELSGRLQYENRFKDVVLDTYLEGMEGYFGRREWNIAERNMSREDREAYGQRIYRDVAAYLETGASPNSVSHYGLDRAKEPALTCWQVWLSCLLGFKGVSQLCEKFLELFLLHGADANFWFWFGSPTTKYRHRRVWWPALREISVPLEIWDDEWREDHVRKVVSFPEETSAEENSEGRAISLGDMLLILFPQTGARLKELADRNLGSEASPPPEEAWGSSKDSVLDTDSRPSSSSGS